MTLKLKGVFRNGKVELSEPREALADGTPVEIHYEAPKRPHVASHFGVLAAEDAAAMLAAIEDGCERIDRDGW
jgi:hypothetical protein